MGRYLNKTDDTYWDLQTRSVVGPGGTLDVPDEFDEHYEDHPIYDPIPVIVSSVAPAAVETPKDGE